LGGSDDVDENKSFEDQIEVVNKRIDDLKWSINLYAGAVSLLALALSIFLGLRLNAETASLRELEKQLKEEVKESLGKTTKTPEVIIHGPDGRPLQGRDLKSALEKRADGSVWLTFHIMPKNVGRVTSGPIFTKLYTSAPLTLYQPSTDEPEFQYEDFIKPEQIDPGSLPAGVSLSYNLRFEIKPPIALPLPGKYPALLKLAYGDGLSTRAEFTIVLESP
jgi:hypothetical protein